MKDRICACLLTLCLILTGILLVSCTETVPDTTPDNAVETVPEATAETAPETTADTPPEVTVEDLLRTASEKFAALESYAAVQTTATSAAMAGTTFDQLATTDLKIDRKAQTAFICDESSDTMGRLIKLDRYYDTEWVYTHVHETNVNSASQYKHERTAADGNHEFGFPDVLQPLPAELLVNIKPTKNEDGSHTISLTVPADTFAQTHGELIKSFLGDNTENSDAQVEITVTEDGYYKEYKINFSATATVEGESASLSATVAIVFENPGAPVEVTLPEGYENFPTARVTYN